MLKLQGIAVSPGVTIGDIGYLGFCIFPSDNFKLVNSAMFNLIISFVIFKH